ncbi:MAG: type II toxin-antitoxin system HicB family antitoxin [Proteobacteria bacterium]|nr:type II toxin-antitoxin system HicB family antitoxin [Pseudomonadota bacterium]
MEFSYPVDLTPQDDGSVLVTFPDVRGAVTDGDTEAEALFEATDCLVAALGGYIELRRDIPAPSRPRRGQPVVTVPPLVAAKLALYRAMRGSGLTRVALGKRLGISEGAVRRLLDLDHRSHIGQVEAALAVLGKRLVVEVRDTAA